MFEKAMSDTLQEKLRPPSIHGEIETFVTQIEALNTSLPLVMRMVRSTRQSRRKEFNEFLERNGTFVEATDTRKIYRLQLRQVPELKRQERRLKRLDVGQTILPRSFVVSLVSQFDFFVGRLIRSLYELRPELLNVSERQLSFAELVKFGSMERAKEYVLEKEIETLLRRSHPEQFDWLEKKFDLHLTKHLPIWSTFVEVTERRNIFVHCNGLVSSQYLAACQNHKVIFEAEPVLGEELRVTSKYFEAAYRCIFEIGVKLAQVLWRKVLPHDLSNADNSLLAVTYDLLHEEHFALAMALSDFAVDTLKKHSTDNHRRVFIINRAQAYKWNGDDAVCKSIIEREDWSACDHKFKLAVAVLQDDFADAANWMRRIGNTEDREQEYKEWPLFREFRKSEDFRSTYADVFGKNYETVQNSAEEIQTTDATIDSEDRE